MEQQFKKSSRSEATGSCVELAVTGPDAVRDSKNVTGPALRFEGAAVLPLIGKIKTGSLDVPS